jgi:hypothetical protein
VPDDVQKPTVEGGVVQHCSLSAPQPPQLPALHVCPLGQGLLAPTHVPFAQHPPLSQALPLQHGSPGPPQVRQVKPEQAVFGSLQRLPVQQFSPSLPQAMQLPPWQTAFASQTFEAQQGSPGAPQF